jgi:hypothetical protein
MKVKFGDYDVVSVMARKEDDHLLLILLKLPCHKIINIKS